MDKTINLTFSEEAGEETLELINEIITGKKQDTSTMFIIAPTGKGKSYFIKNDLYNYCKEHNLKILYFLPRQVVKDEFIKELQGNKEKNEPDKTDIIKVYTYQQFEKKEEYPSFYLYDIIICDECHYFISDSTFNPFTYRSYERIIEDGADKLKIFITATPNPVMAIVQNTMHRQNINILEEENKRLVYFIRLQGVSVVKDIEFFKVGWSEQKHKNVQRIIDKIDKTEDKAIVFCDSKQDALELHEKYKNNSLFICSRSSDKKGKYFKANAINSAPEAYSKMLSEHRFDCKYVFCTSALDVGFSINDKQVKHIICMLQDWNGVIQAVGRKRIMNKDLNDRVTLYLPYYSNQTIGKKKKEGLKMLEHRNYLYNYGAAAYMEKYEKIPDPAKIVYYRHTKDGACEPAIDEFVYENILRQNWIWYKISQIDSPEQHKDWICQQFGLVSKRHERTLYGIERDLKPFADSKRVFTKEDKKIIVDIINHKNRENGLQVKSMQKLEEYLQEINCRYMIVIGEKREKIDGKDKKTTTYQIVERPTGQDE